MALVLKETNQMSIQLNNNVFCFFFKRLLGGRERDCIQIENPEWESWCLDWDHMIREFLDSMLRCLYTING